MRVPFVDLRIQYKHIKKEIDAATKRVIQKAKFIQGEDVQEFEREFADYLDTNYCIGVNSGTDALILGVRALALSPNDEVLVPANTYISSALAASENNLKVVFVDMDENDYGINLADLKRKITSRTKAVMLIHLYGQPDKIDEVRTIIQQSKKNICLIEDACQAHGASYKGQKVGTFGAFSAFSFYPGKNLGAYGDAGAVVTNDVRLAKSVKLLREYGQEKKYFHISIGVNSRLDSIQAAVLRVKLKYLDQWNKQRIAAAALYSTYLNQYVPFITTPSQFRGRDSIFHVYVVRTPQRNELFQYLNAHGIQAQIHYPLPLHLQKAYRFLGYKRGDLPIVEKVSSEILSLPMYPEITETAIRFITRNIQRYFRDHTPIISQEP